MKKSASYEILAAVLGMIGVILLVFTYYPILNPIQYKIDHHHATAPLSRFIIGTPFSLLFLSVAWFFNHKTQKLKRDENNPKCDQNSKPS